MPVRNVVKDYTHDSFFHASNKGVDGRKIFQEESDYEFFTVLLERYLSPHESKDNYGRRIKTFYDAVELQAYILLPNSFHLVLFINGEGHQLSEFIRSLCAAYTTYFNKKYKRSGHLFKGPFRALRLQDNDSVVKVSRYVHRRHKDYLSWKHSSVNHFIGDAQSEWVRPDKLYSFYEWGTYERYLKNDEDFSQSKEDLRRQLADD